MEVKKTKTKFVMTLSEMFTARRKYQPVLVRFIENYIKENPDYDEIKKRVKQGELLCIDYRTLEVSLRNEADLTEKKDVMYYYDRFENLYADNILNKMIMEYRGNERVLTPDYSKIYDIADSVIGSYVRYHDINDGQSLPDFLKLTKEEIAAKEEENRLFMEEQAMRQREKSEIMAEHAFRAGTEPVMLIIPDVHGRTFWKEAVEKYPDLPVIFLGDYLDPYSNSIEEISRKEAFNVFLDILEYRKERTEGVTMLLGNHDLHYFCDMNSSRKDNARKVEIRRLFEENIDFFKIAEIVTVADKTILFSHAGILPGWLEQYFPQIRIDNPYQICEEINKRFETDSLFKTCLLRGISCHRGGHARFGSPVWADVVEHHATVAYTRDKPKDEPFALQGDVFQIFGHSQQEEDPVYRPHFCCLDCRRAFLLTKNGEVMEIE